MFFCGVGAGCHARPLMADTRRGGLLVKTVYSHCVRRIENTQSARRGKREVFSISPYERMASLERDKPRSLQQLRFAGTGRAVFTRISYQNEPIL